MSVIRGSIVALVTPYQSSGDIDEDALSQLIEWHIQEGTDAILLCGTTGEAPVLSENEHLRILQKGVEVAAGRVPIIGGTGSYNTAHAVHLTQKAKQIGVDACIIILPYYNRPTPEGCFLHIQEIGKVELPMIIYHHPGRTGLKLTVEALEKISCLPSVMGIKDCSMDGAFFAALRQKIEKPLFTGDDVLTLACMAMGGEGVISVVANVVPREWKQLTLYMNNGQLHEAQILFTRLYPLIQAIGLETNPQCIKYALSLLGKCSASMRLPLLEPTLENKEKIKKVMYAMDDLFTHLSSSSRSQCDLPLEWTVGQSTLSNGSSHCVS